MKPAWIQRNARLARALAIAMLLGSSHAAAVEEFTIGGAGAGLGTMQRLAEEFTAKNPDVRIRTVPSLGSHGGIRAVVGGAIALAVTSRPLSEGERGLGVVAVEYARTPFVLSVSEKSGITGITTTELTDIYAGKTITWADGSPIRMVLRPENDIDTIMLKGMSAEIERAITAAATRPGMPIAPTDQHAADNIERIPGAIGPTSLAVIISENRGLRALKLDGREPSVANAASGAYPYYKRLFLVWSRKRPAVVDRFIAFVQSAAGRKITASNGQWIP